MSEEKPEGSLYSKATRAFGWSFASTALGRLSTLAIGIAIARLLGPEEFGTFAVATVALVAVLSFNELGVSLAIVRWPGDPRAIAPTVMTISVISSIIVYIGCYFGAPVFAAAMGEPSATGVIRVLTISVILDGFLATPVAMLQRNFRQDRKMIADQTTHWVGSLTSIACAIAGLGAMSLAIGRLAGAITGGSLFVAFAPGAVRFGFDRSVAKALFKFGLPLAGSSIVVFVVNNVDKIIVGAVLGPVTLGYYVLAANLAGWPVNILSQPVRAVAPAAFARLQAVPDVMRSTFLSTGGLLGAVTLPGCILLAAVADPLVRVVYGTVWEPAATVLPWLAVVAALRIFFEFFYDYFVVLANSRVVLTVQTVWLIALVPTLYFGSRQFGLPGAGAAQVAVSLLAVLPIYLYELNKVGITASALSSRVVWSLVGALAVAGIVVALDRVLSSDLLVIVLSGLVGGAAVGALVYRMRAALRSLRHIDPTPPPTPAPTSA